MYGRRACRNPPRHILRRGSRPGVQRNERVRLPLGERQPQCRPFHRGRLAHTQRMVQLPDVHPQTVRPIERFPRAQTPDAKSQGTRDNTVWLRHIERARVTLRHPAPGPPQLPDSLHRLVEEQPHRPPRGVCGAHGERETAEVRDVRRAGGRRRLHRRAGKMVDMMSPVRPQSLRYQRRSVDDCGKWCKVTEQGAERFMAKWISAEKARAGLRHAVVCPNVTGRTKERIAQSKRAHVDSFAMVN